MPPRERVRGEKTRRHSKVKGKSFSLSILNGWTTPNMNTNYVYKEICCRTLILILFLLWSLRTNGNFRIGNKWVVT